MARFVVQQSGRLTVNGVAQKQGDIIDIPPHLAEEYGRDLVIPEGETPTERPAAKPKKKAGAEL